MLIQLRIKIAKKKNKPDLNDHDLYQFSKIEKTNLILPHSASYLICIFF